MWHPVGRLPARVYWRRRIVVLIVLLSVLAGLCWLAYALATGRLGGDEGGTSTAAAPRSVPTPALERVVPSLSELRTPTPPPPAEAAGAQRAATAPTPSPGGRCTDVMLALEVRAPATVAVGSAPTLELVVRNTSSVACVRPLDKALQEIVLTDAGGARVWGSNDCFPEAGPDTRTLAPGAAVSFPLVWSGLTSDPACTAPRVTPPAGDYVLRGRLDTKGSAGTPITIR